MGYENKIRFFQGDVEVKYRESSGMAFVSTLITA